jgi:hypothetical protein
LQARWLGFDRAIRAEDLSRLPQYLLKFEEEDRMWMEEWQAAQVFLKYDYVEWKDLCKSFLTLSSATLILSITFAEKVVGVQTAKVSEKVPLLTCWIALLAAVASCGLGLVMLSVAANYAAIKVIVKNGPVLFMGQPYSFYCRVSTVLIIIAGLFYILALASKARAGWRTMTLDQYNKQN